MAEHNNTSTDTNAADQDRITRILNTAVIATKMARSQNASARLQELMRKPGFQIILRAMRDYAQEYGVSEQAAAQAMIQAFRELDGIWDDFIFQEGLDRLKGQITSSG